MTAHYLDALGVPAVRGRAFTAAEAETRSGVAVVNVGMARRHFAPRDGRRAAVGAEGVWPVPRDLGAIDPMGRRFRLLDEPRPAWFTVIGVVPDVMIEEVGEREVTPAAFLPYPISRRRTPASLVRALATPPR